MNPLHPENVQDLKQLIDFLKENQVAEFAYDHGDVKVRLRFDQPQAAEQHAPPRPAAVAAAPVVAPAPASAAPAAPADPLAGLHLVKSPMVGTYYGSPSPGSAPFVAVGDRVEKGKILCILEAMKLMNEIESDAAGEIVKCLVSNGQPIEFGQPLFALRVG
jgi:acetyl-CoA carboxylase biotin carboxyl carrier protein